MKNMVKLILIMIAIMNTCLPLKPEEHFDVQIKKDGWELPKFDNFDLPKRKHECGELYNNCFEEYYKAKEKINFLVNYCVVDKYRADLLYIENRTTDLIIRGLTIIYYKDKPFCRFYVGEEVQREKEYHEPSFLAVLDMDLDGKYELKLGSSDVIEFFLKFSPKVDENDRYKGPIYIDGKEIK